MPQVLWEGVRGNELEPKKKDTLLIDTKQEAIFHSKDLCLLKTLE
jgi:hypothetical protein